MHITSSGVSQCRRRLYKSSQESLKTQKSSTNSYLISKEVQLVTFCQQKYVLNNEEKFTFADH